MMPTHRAETLKMIGYPDPDMLSSAPSRPLRILNERLLITKIITCLGLALLLVIGAWSAAHSEADGTVATAEVSTISSLDAASASTITGDAEALPLSGGTIPLSAWADESTLLAGAVGCLLGIFCTILLVAFLRFFVLRRHPPLIGVVARAISAHVAPIAPARQPLTLAQLSVSRT